MRFWEFEGNAPNGKPLRWMMLEAGLQGKWGKVIAECEGTFGSIFTLELKYAYPKYVIAKVPKIRAGLKAEEIQQTIGVFLHEINETYKYKSSPLISRHFEIKICSGLPVVLSRKWDWTLEDLIAAGPASRSAALSTVIQLAHALTYCAARGLSAHQDQKPANVLLEKLERFRGQDGSKPPIHLALICDFGMANAFSVFGKPNGSYPYMAPEQYEGQPATLAKADVFALGVILHELLTGGFHPIGERTSDVWPIPLPSKPKKWEGGDMWRHWSRRDRAIDLEQVGSQPLADIIQKCLSTDLSTRSTSSGLEQELFEQLKSEDNIIRDYLRSVLSHFDDMTLASEAGGWPYYEQLLEQINAYDYS